MKRKFSTQFSVPKNASENERVIFDQLKQVTDDLATALDGALSLDNISSNLQTLAVNSGVEVNLGRIQKRGKTLGAFILHTNNATVSDYKTRYDKDGNILATVSVSPSPAIITFVLLGE